MAENVIGNYAFMYHINRELYDKLYSAERQARTNFRSSGHECREALEIFIRIVLNKANLTKACKGQELSLKIQNLRDESFLRQEGYLKQSESLKDKWLLPELGTISFKYEDGREEHDADYWDFIRKFGNTCSHADTRRSDVKVSYDNAIKCLKGLFLLLKRYYKGQISNNIESFDENMMPIEEYCVYDSYVPEDSVRSSCIREFLAYTLDSNGEKGVYAILRLYNKKNIVGSDVFMLRNQACFTEASKVSFTAVPDGMTILRELIPTDSNKSDFYIISYLFNQEPTPLTNTLLAKMDLKQRIRFCARIVNCLDNLHTSPVPIYHRMLNFDCVYACEIRNEWIPYIVKFDYAKIVTNGGTVAVNAARAKELVKKEEKLNKYIAPEWDSIVQDTDSQKWARVDIYSLGILCSEIIAGEISVKAPSIDSLEEQGLSDDILDLLDYMTAEDPEERWGIDDVKDIFDEELRKMRKK